jgi:hypothetical protein
MAHSDALTSACLLFLKGSVSSFWLCADDFLPRQEDNFRARRDFAFVPTTEVPASFVHLVGQRKRRWRRGDVRL